MKNVFDNIDVNHSGFIDLNELHGVSQALGHELTPSELEIVFNELDENGD
jgi:Ca2+-binding EF-hand superfamily protein